MWFDYIENNELKITLDIPPGVVENMVPPGVVE